MTGIGAPVDFAGRTPLGWLPQKGGKEESVDLDRGRAALIAEVSFFSVYSVDSKALYNLKTLLLIELQSTISFISPSHFLHPSILKLHHILKCAA